MGIEMKAIRIPNIKDRKARLRRYSTLLESFSSEEALSYFIKEEDSSFVKIGTVSSKWNLESRLSSLQTATPHVLVLIGVTDMKEKDLHRKFGHLRCRGEWFEYTKEIENFLKNKFQVPTWLKLQKCPACKQASNFHQEEIVSSRWGDRFPVVIGDDGTLFADRENKSKLDFPFVREPFNAEMCICEKCRAEVKIDDIQLVDDIPEQKS